MQLTRDKIKLALALAAVVAGVGAVLSDRPIDRPPGILAPHEPLQQDLADAQPREFLDYQLRPRANFSMEARVLSVEHYRWDAGSRLAPVDFALGWGPMSDSALLAGFEITQGARFYTLYPQDESAEIGIALRHSANMHLIPADGTVRRVLESAREGHLIALRGQLVDAAGPDGFTWRTSLRRDDTGDGACELFLVESATFR